MIPLCAPGAASSPEHLQPGDEVRGHGLCRGEREGLAFACQAEGSQMWGLCGAGLSLVLSGSMQCNQILFQREELLMLNKCLFSHSSEKFVMFS